MEGGGALARGGVSTDCCVEQPFAMLFLLLFSCYLALHVRCSGCGTLSALLVRGGGWSGCKMRLKYCLRLCGKLFVDLAHLEGGGGGAWPFSLLPCVLLIERESSLRDLPRVAIPPLV